MVVPTLNPGIADGIVAPVIRPLTKEGRLVREAAAMLDEHYPGWADHVDSGTLDLLCSEHCILGQVGRKMWGKAFYEMVVELHERGVRSELLVPFVAESPREALWDYERFTPAWQEEIATRQAA